jgi:hypothetical protein
VRLSPLVTCPSRTDSLALYCAARLGWKYTLRLRVDHGELPVGRVRAAPIRRARLPLSVAARALCALAPGLVAGLVRRTLAVRVLDRHAVPRPRDGGAARWLPSFRRRRVLHAVCRPTASASAYVSPGRLPATFARSLLDVLDGALSTRSSDHLLHRPLARSRPLRLVLRQPGPRADSGLCQPRRDPRLRPRREPRRLSSAASPLPARLRVSPAAATTTPAASSARRHVSFPAAAGRRSGSASPPTRVLLLAFSRRSAPATTRASAAAAAGLVGSHVARPPRRGRRRRRRHCVPDLCAVEHLVPSLRRPSSPLRLHRRASSATAVPTLSLTAAAAAAPRLVRHLSEHAPRLALALGSGPGPLFPRLFADEGSGWYERRSAVWRAQGPAETACSFAPRSLVRLLPPPSSRPFATHIDSRDAGEKKTGSATSRPMRATPSCGSSSRRGRRRKSAASPSARTRRASIWTVRASSRSTSSRGRTVRPCVLSFLFSGVRERKLT